MKNNLKTLTLILLIILASCSKEESSSEEAVNEQAIEELENTPLEANTVANNVVIPGATKNDGTPPEPNNGISLDISGSSETAFLNEGFEIDINSNGNVSGAYLIFKSKDGMASDTYYDINIAANSLSDKVGVRQLLKSKKNNNSSKLEDEVALDIDFNANIEPGTFCYEICVYDDGGNISAPQEVCVTVESWGGNSDLVAEWNFIKEEYITPEESDVYEVGVPDCYESPIFCDSGDEITATICDVQEYGIMEIKADGTFVVDFKSSVDNLDYFASAEQCAAVKEESEYRFQVEGNWAYVADESRFTLVAYSFTVLEEGETEIDVLPGGEAELLFDGIVQINGNVLTITESFGSYSDDELDSSYTLYFEK